MRVDPPPVSAPSDAEWFDEFTASKSTRLLQALVARFGVDAGSDAHAEALAWGWEHRTELRVSENPVGYLSRVAQSSMRPQIRWWRRTVLVEHDARAEEFDVDLDLAAALTRLRRPERVAVVLVHAHGWSYAEVADVLGVSIAHGWWIVSGNTGTPDGRRRDDIWWSRDLRHWSELPLRLQGRAGSGTGVPTASNATAVVAKSTVNTPDELWIWNP